jgi:hypothetical protein
MTYYKAEFSDDSIEVFMASSDSEAVNTARKLENEHGYIFNIFRLDENYNEEEEVFN